MACVGASLGICGILWSVPGANSEMGLVGFCFLVLSLSWGQVSIRCSFLGSGLSVKSGSVALLH